MTEWFNGLEIYKVEIGLTDGVLNTEIILALTFDLPRNDSNKEMKQLINKILEPYIKGCNLNYDAEDDFDGSDKFEFNEATGWIYQLAFKDINNLIRFAKDHKKEIVCKDVMVMLEDTDSMDFEDESMAYLSIVDSVNFEDTNNVELPTTLKDEELRDKMINTFNSIVTKVVGYNVLANLEGASNGE